MKADTASPNVLVVGAGVVGLACAHYLRQSGASVTVIDRGAVAGGCSRGNCGHILPSHVLPLNSWAAVRLGLKSFFGRSNAPLRLKPQWDLSLALWFCSFLKYCGESSVAAAARALKPLLALSANQYGEILPGLGGDADWRDNGLLYLFKEQAALDRFAVTDGWLSAQFDIRASRVSPDDLLSLEPALSANLAGGFRYEQDASLSPEKLTAAWRRALEERGVEFVENCTFQSLEAGDGEIKRLICSGTVFEPESVVFAMGAMSGRLSSQLQARLPVVPGKGFAINIPERRGAMNHPCVMPEKGVATTPFSDALRIGSIIEFAGFDDTIPPERIAYLLRGVNDFITDKIAPDALDAWAGWRPMTPDSLPIIGPIRAFRNAFIATGHQMIGVMTAPATGRLVADYIMGRRLCVPASAYLPSRFS